MIELWIMTTKNASAMKEKFQERVKKYKFSGAFLAEQRTIMPIS